MLLYLLHNRVNDKLYVGQTRQSFALRWQRHRGDRNKRHNPIACAIQKYGPSAFEKHILREGFTNQAHLDEAEKLWIAILRSSDKRFGYNVQAGGKGGAQSEETRRKISETMRRKGIQPCAEAIKIARRGKVHSLETKAKMRAAKLGKPSAKLGKEYAHLRGRKDSPEVCEIKRVAAKKRGITPEVRIRMIAGRRAKRVSGAAQAA